MQVHVHWGGSLWKRGFFQSQSQGIVDGLKYFTFSYYNGLCWQQFLSFIVFLFLFSTTGRISASESLLTYGSGESWADFNDPNFPVQFLSDLENSASPTLIATADAECGNNLQCRYDVLATGVAAAGKATLDFENDIMEDIEAVCNFT